MDNIDSSPQKISLFSRIKNFFSAPVFEDEAQSRKALLLNRLILLGIILLIVALSTIGLFYLEPLVPSILMSGLLIILIVMFFILRLGYIEAVANGIILSTWIVVAVSTFFAGGVISPFYISLILIVPASSFLISERASFIYGIANIAVGTLLILVQRSNLFLEISSTSPPEIIFLIVSLISIFGATFISVRNRTLLFPDELSAEQQKAFQDNIQELESVTSELTEINEQSQQEINQFNRYLVTSNKIIQDTLSLNDPQEILEKSAAIIGENLDFYHVGIFLIDPENEWAVLRAASSPGGMQMIARNHRLQVGKQGIVGYVTGIGQARISQDIGLDRIHSTTAELPDTRSEMTLPLKIRGNIIGALDIQDNKENAFSEKDITFFQILADQIALLIDNTTLNEKVAQYTDEVQRAYGEYSQQIWTEALIKKTTPAFRYSPHESREVSLETSPNISAPSEGKKEVPIFIRGHRVGSIDIYKSDDKDWTNEENNMLQTLSDQLGVALDSARLFSETQQRAATEHIISEFGAEIREILDIETILKTATEKMRDVLDLPQVTIRMAPPQEVPDNSTVPAEEEIIDESLDS